MKYDMKYWVFSLLFIFSHTARTQTLFSFGPNKVSRQEFLKAYTKNNLEATPQLQTYRDYLDLYVRFKLKVQAALDMRLDTSAQQREELSSFRNQITENYLTDQETLNRLIEEAMNRVQQDIQVGHIFIAVRDKATPEEESRARDKAITLYDRLQNGEDFGKLAAENSDDPSGRERKGDLGYITGFTLPYEFETAIYSLAPGSVGRPFRSKLGFHLFKHMGQRPAFGRIKVAHILIGFPPQPTDEQRKAAHLLADSLYLLLKQGADFKDLALSYSTDNLTFRNGGELAEFGIGRYDPAFESAAFSLAKDGDISRPVETPYGVHLIRRLQYFPVSADPQNALDRDAFRQRVTGNDRLQIARQVMTQKIFTRVNYKKAVVDQVAFQRLSDSILAGQPARYTALFKPTTPLFTCGQKTATVANWVTFLESVREQEEEEKKKPVADLLDRFTEKVVVGYYRDHLENFSADFAAQVREFKEGNLLFEIMQKKIWDVATQDTQGLKKYFDAQANRYWWEPSADVILITANSDSAARRAAVALQADPSQWREWVEHSGGALQADSGRFELSQLPIPDTNLIAERKVMPSVKNEVEKMVLFCYIFKLYPQRSLRSFTDARGLVINDYQNYLEEQWLQSLKKKYPVVINEPVVRSLLK